MLQILAPRTRLQARASIALLLLATATTSLSLGGCRDAEDGPRVRSQEQIAVVANNFRKAMILQTAENGAETSKELESLLGQLTDVTDDQRGPAALLTSNIAREIGSIRTAAIRAGETQARYDRDVIVSAAESAAALEALADAEGALSLGDDRQLLQGQKAAAEAALKGLQDAVNQLQRPIDQLRASSSSKKNELTALDQKADELRRKANESDAKAALAYVEEGATVKGQARQVKVALAGDEIQLNTLEPELGIANIAASAAQSVAAAANAAMGELENYSSALKTDADGLRKRADELRKVAADATAKLVEEANGAMATAYEQADAILAKALSSAGGASGDLGKAAAQAKLAAQAAIGNLYAEQAAGLTSQIGLFQRLASAGTLFGGESGQKEAIAALSTKREEAITKAKDAYTAVNDMLGGMNAEDPNVIRTKAAIEGSLAALEGRKVEAAPGAAPGAASTAGAGFAQSSGTLITTGGGFPSKEELVAAFTASRSDPEAAIALLRRGWAFNGPQGREFFDAIMGLADAMMPVLVAARDKFGAEAVKGLDAQAGGAGFNPLTGTFEQVDRGDKSYLKVAGKDGTTKELELVQVNGAWFVRGDAVFGGMDPQEAQMAKAMLPMFKAMAGGLRTAAEEVAAKIKSGEITSADQIRGAIQEAMKNMAPPPGFGGPQGN